MRDYLINASFWFLIALGLYCAVAVLMDAIRRRSFKPSERFTCTDERCIAVRIKQAKAAQRMKKLGHQTLLDGKEHVPSVNHIAPARKPAITVVTLRRKS